MTRLVATLALLLVSTRVEAQPAEDARARAATAFADAERAFGDEDYPEALRLFRAAFAAAPDDAVRFNIAVCLERLGRFREAGIEYEAAAASTTLPEDVRARARTEAERVRGRLGTLVVDGTPHGAAIRVDGVELCRIPCTSPIDPGRHDVVATLRDMRAGQPVIIERGATTRITLRAVAPPPQRRGPGVLTWVGAGVTAAGVAGTIGFGLRARGLHEDYIANPTMETRDDGLRARNIANVSLGVAILGASAVAVDLFVFARRTKPRHTAVRAYPGGALVEVKF